MDINIGVFIASYLCKFLWKRYNDRGTDWVTGESGFDSKAGTDYFSSPHSKDRLWDPAGILLDDIVCKGTAS